MSHPCDRFSCPEYNQGQCFGGGCRANPAPSEPDAEDGEDENENTQEDNQ